MSIGKSCVRGLALLAMPALFSATVGVPGAQAQSSTAEGSERDSASIAGVPNSAFFAGVGGSYNFVTYGNQWIYNKGISQTFQNGVQTSSGTASGPATTTIQNQTTFAPVAQAGYFSHFAGSPWMWGGKFSYSYLASTAVNRNISIPQAGTSTANVGGFSGHSVTGAYRIAVYNQTSLMPLVGRSFEKSFFYVGAGPTLSQVKTQLNNVVGYANFSPTVLTNVSGANQSFSNDQWRLGVGATAGVTYFVTPQWFVDLSYSASMPNASLTQITSPFNNPGTPNSFRGTLIGAYTANVMTQAITITINRAF
ncbi:hypothetical protein BH11PSE3_BH11PSE3_37940 [soil metagenome]